MATRRTATAEQPPAPKLQLTTAAIERGIGRLDERIAELRNVDIAKLPKGTSPELNALSVAIQDTLVRCFGERTSAYNRFQGAASLQFFPGFASANYPQQHHYQEGAQKNIANSLALLQEAQRALREDLEDAKHEAPQEGEVRSTGPSTLSRRVFVVHGHDGEARELVARFLKAMDFEPVILHEQPNQGGTVIEKFEANSDVGFAVVLLTPDDVGRSIKEEELKARARQNVLLELGYFIGHLGRDKVCALRRGDVELPSDYVGVVWEKMDEGGGWKLALARELKAAGHEVDLNKAFSL
ncbi:TIR domain-containing protein [Burkholderia pseudomallei]|uniref:TIR domain-containing protein n=1 Tax=Burkholderia pseudomallei TaxID=28450 RepID=UPI0005E60EA0|nr:nucleotide-binding protein [Burkholderia pseudomallei]CPF80450.1 nucleotide-binding protein [Burkholderia pseudomallei]